MTDDVAVQAERIYDRALGWEPASQLSGDVAAHVALGFHGLVMNGGVLHGVDREADYVSAAADAFRWLGLVEVADLIDDARRAAATGASRVPGTEARLDRRYDTLLPEDRALEVALGKSFQGSPDAFS